MKLNKQQVEFIRKLGLNINPNRPLTDDEESMVEEKVANHLQVYGFDEEYKPTKEGIMCESILDLL